MFAPGFLRSASGAIVAGTAVTSLADSGTYTISLPAGIASGNLLIILVSHLGDGRIGTNVPTGFTRLGSIRNQNGSGHGEYGVFRRAATGTEGATATMTNGGSVGGAVALRITGHQGTPEIAQNASGSETFDPPSLAPSWGSGQTLWLACLSLWYNSAQPTIVFPANYTANNAQSPNGQAAIGWRNAIAPSENPAAFSLTGANGNEVAGAPIIAVRSA